MTKVSFHLDLTLRNGAELKLGPVFFGSLCILTPYKNGIIQKFWNTIAENVVPEINTIVFG